MSMTTTSPGPAHADSHELSPATIDGTKRPQIMPSMTDLTIRPATRADGQLLAGLAERLASFHLPPWRTPESIANADAGAMMEAIEEGNGRQRGRDR